jgi:hypothetical protein
MKKSADRKHNVASVAPTANDDVSKGYSPLSTWIDDATNKAYKAIATGVGAAIWIETSFPDAPNDGQDYVRNSLGWSLFSGADGNGIYDGSGVLSGATVVSYIGASLAFRDGETSFRGAASTGTGKVFLAENQNGSSYLELLNDGELKLNNGEFKIHSTRPRIFIKATQNNQASSIRYLDLSDSEKCAIEYFGSSYSVLPNNLSFTTQSGVGGAVFRIKDTSSEFSVMFDGATSQGDKKLIVKSTGVIIKNDSGTLITPDAQLHVRGNSDSINDNAFLAENDSGTKLLSLKNNGYMGLGIGASSPSAKLHVQGSGATSGTTALLVENSAGTDLLEVKDDGTIIGAFPIGGGVGTDSFLTNGVGSSAAGTNAISLGLNSNAANTNSVAIGDNTDATANNALALGSRAQATASESTSVGVLAVASGQNSVALGYTADATKISSLALGHSAQATSNYGISIGNSANANTGTDSIAIGRSSNASGVRSLAFGLQMAATAQNAYILGQSFSGVRTNATANSLEVNFDEATSTIRLAKSVDSWINTSANFGVGHTAPSAKLHVSGSTLLDGSLQITDGTEGTIGHVWTSTGVNGEGSWAAAGGGTNFSKVLWLDPNGNDGTGAKGDNTKPFLLPEAVRDAASSGDTIVVNAGAFDVVTTDANGLYKAGVSWFFMPESYFTKSTTGDMFSGADAKVLGYGNFERTGGALGGIFDVSGSSIIEFNNCDSSNTSYTIQITGAPDTPTKILGRGRCKSTGSYAVYANTSSHAYVDISEIVSTATTAIFLGSRTNNDYKNTVISDYIHGASSNGLYMGSGSATFGYCNYVTTNGQGCSISLNGVIGVLTTSDLIDQSSVTVNGYCRGLINNGATVYANGIGFLTHNAGATDATIKYSSVAGTTTSSTINDGKVVLRVPERVIGSRGGSLNITGGEVEIIGNITSLPDGDIPSNYWNFTGGKIVMKVNATISSSTWAFIHLSGADLDITNSTLNSTASTVTKSTTIATSKFNALITYSSGILTVNGSTFKTNNAESFPLHIAGSGLDLRVLSGGVNSNVVSSGLFAARKQKDKFTVSAGSDAGLTIDDGVNTPVVILESDFATYSTAPLMAERLKDLINAASPLNVIATWTASDSFFFIESTVAGSPISLGSFNSVSRLIEANNSYAPNDLLGAVAASRVLENVNV